MLQKMHLTLIWDKEGKCSTKLPPPSSIINYMQQQSTIHFLYFYTELFYLRRFIWSKNVHDHLGLLIIINNINNRLSYTKIKITLHFKVSPILYICTPTWNELDEAKIKQEQKFHWLQYYTYRDPDGERCCPLLTAEVLWHLLCWSVNK